MENFVNQEIKKRWIAALRSGKYTQGQEHLRRGDAYCCLGVLCDLNENTQWTLSCHPPTKKIYLPTPEAPETTIPPKFILEWAGLDPKLVDTLIHLNDLEDYTFDQIADYLEALNNSLTFQ